MNEQIKVFEKFLYEIWKTQNFAKVLLTKDGQHIDIIDCGAENKDSSGPDFKNARIKIGNITFTGDVEIDNDYNDWKNHGHNINKKYNSVILHAVLNGNANKGYVITSDGRKVQSISLLSFLNDSLVQNVQKAITSERSNTKINKMRCIEVSSELTDDDKLNFIYDLGVQRFKKKKDKMHERLKEIIYVQEMNLKEPVIRYELNEQFYDRTFTQKDFCQKIIWEQLVYESIFEALGYSKNKEIMKTVAMAAGIKFLSSLNKHDFILTVEAVVFNVGGLMPDLNEVHDEEISAYVKKLSERWNEIKNKYSGRTFNSTQWHFFRIRPQNFPTIRIAGGARIANKLINSNLIDKMLEAVEQISDLNKLAQALRSLLVIKGDGFWSRHYVFTPNKNEQINYFIGATRADEILVNIILPVLSLYFDIFDKKELSMKAVNLYVNFYQKSENNLVNEVAESLLLKDAWKRSVLYQGMIELFRDYCSKERCLECTIGKKVFN
ncbi:MAG: DUF2851 family protein [Ignavibacteriaceae bacterium]|nr:DUF2851 family protein [Ignavibacteriaceae bacterium]